jgi:hypothetical protein
MQFLEVIRALASPHRGGAFPDALADTSLATWE